MAITAPEAHHRFDPKQPFNRAQARAAGIGLKTLLSSRFQKVFYDCYISSDVPLTTKLRAKAALGISPPGSFVSHSTAARIWGEIHHRSLSVPTACAAKRSFEKRINRDLRLRPDPIFGELASHDVNDSPTH